MYLPCLRLACDMQIPDFDKLSALCWQPWPCFIVSLKVSDMKTLVDVTGLPLITVRDTY